MNPDTELREVLRRRADDAPITPTPLGVIAGRARRVQRRRRTGIAVGAAAAVAAVVVPVTVMGGADRVPEPAPVGPAGQPVDVDAPPRIGYAIGETYYLPDGTTAPLPDADSMWAWAPPGSTGVYSATGPQGEHLLYQTRFSEDGVIGEGWCSGHPPAVGVDATYAFTMVPCDLPLEGSGPTSLTVQPLEGGPRIQEIAEFAYPVGLLGTGEVVYADTGDGGVWVTDLESDPRRIPDLAEAFATTSEPGGPTLVADRFIEGDWGVLAPDGTVQWRRDDLAGVHAFNPSGTLLLARSADEQLVILNALTGDVVTIVADSGPADFPTLGTTVWEDDRYLLTTRVYNKGGVLARIDTTNGTYTDLGQVPGAPGGPGTDVLWSPVPVQ